MEPISGSTGGNFQFPSESEMAGLPDGNYRAQVSTSELATSQSGNVMWKLKLEIIEPAQFLGKFVRDNIVFSNAAAGMTFGKLKALGMAVQAGQPFNPSGGAHKQVEGKKVAIRTKAEDFNGVISPKVQGMSADPGPGGLRNAGPSTNTTAGRASTPPIGATTKPSPSTNPAEKTTSEELPF